MKLYIKKSWAMLISLAMILTVLPTGLFNNYVFADGDDEISFGVSPIKQLPSWCWVTSTQMVLKEKLKSEGKLDDDEYIHKKFGESCIEIANEYYDKADYSSNASKFEGKIKKSMAEFESLYNKTVKDRTDGAGKGHQLNKEAAFLVYLCSNKLESSNVFSFNDDEEQNMMMDVVLKATGLTGLKSYYLVFGSYEMDGTGNFKPKPNSNIDNETLGNILYWTLQSGNGPIVTTTNGHHRVVKGVKKESGSWKVLIQETGGNDNKTWKSINEYKNSDFAIKFISKNNVFRPELDEADNLKDIYAFNTKNNKTENVVRFAIDAGETGMGSEHYYITDSHGTEYHLNLLSSNELNGSETNITYSGGVSLVDGNNYSTKNTGTVNLRYYDILGASLNGMTLQELRDTYKLIEKKDKVAVIYYDQEKSNPIQKEYYNKNSDITVKNPNEIDSSLNWSSFRGWNDNFDGNGKLYFGGSQTGSLAEDVKLYPMFGRKITYHRNSSSDDESKETRYKNFKETINLLDVSGYNSLKRDGYKFLGWATKPDGEVVYQPDVKKINAGTYDIDLYAVWEKIPTYGVIYNFNITDQNGDTIEITGSSDGPNDLGNFKSLDDLKEKFKDQSYFEKYFKEAELSHWNTKPDGSGKVYDVGTKINVSGEKDGYLTVYAIYDFKITYKSNDDQNQEFVLKYNAKEGRYVIEQSDERLKTFVNYGKIKYWNDLSGDNGTKYNFGQGINSTKDITLYAIYEAVGRVTYNSNDSDNKSFVLGSNSYNGCILDRQDTSLMNLFKNNNRISHWNTKPDNTGTSYSFNQEIGTKDDIVLYAIYDYKITYHENAGDANKWTETKNNKILSLKDIGQGEDGNLYFSKLGYEFVMWSNDPNGNGEIYSVGQEIKLSDDLNLYAIWFKIEDNKGDTGFEMGGDTGGSGSSGSSGSSGGSSSSSGSGSSGSSDGSSSSSSSAPRSAVEELVATATNAPVLVTYEYKADETNPISAVQAIKNYIKPAVNLTKVVETGKANEKTDKKIDNKDNGAIVFKTNIYKKDSNNQDIASTKENQAVWTFELSKLDKDFAEKYEKAEELDKKVQTNQATQEDKVALAQVNTELKDYNFKLNVAMPKFENVGKDNSILLNKATEVLKDEKSREGVKLVDFISNGKYPGEAVVDLNIGKDSANKQYIVYYVYIDPKTGKTTVMLIKQNDKPFVVTSNKDGYVRFRSDRGAGYILLPNTNENMAKISQLQLSFDHAFSEN